MASRIRRAATPTVSTEVLRFCARRPKNRSVVASHVAPMPGQQTTMATAIKVAPVSMISSGGPPAGTGGIEAVIMPCAKSALRGKSGKTEAGKSELINVR